MNLWIKVLCCFFYINSSSLIGQTFSIIVDPVEGDEGVFHINNFVDMANVDNKLIITGQHICRPNPNSNITCASLSIFDLENGQIESILIDTFANTEGDGLLLKDNRIFLAMYRHGDNFNGRSLFIHEYDLNLELIKIVEVPTRINHTPNINGIEFLGDSFYVFGSIITPEDNYIGYIQKLDTDLNLIWDKQYTHEENESNCEKLQENKDGDLFFIHNYDNGIIASSDGNYGIQIIKLNRDGEKLDSLEIDRGSTFEDDLSLMNSDENMIYTSTRHHPFDDSIFEQSTGRINKYSADLDSLVWSLKLPFDNYNDSRSYAVLNIEQARNGDILVCGAVFDDGKEAPIQPQQNFNANAFILRVTKDGEIKWFHLYKVPNTHPQLPYEEFGYYKGSGMGRITELEDGRILASGVSSFTNIQRNELINTDEAISKFFVLVVDGETGCMDEEECDEIIILDGEYRPQDDYLPVINSDYNWFSERENENGVVQSITHTYSEDSLNHLSNYYFERLEDTGDGLLEPIVNGDFRERKGRIFQKFPGVFNEKLVFDIHLKVGEKRDIEREGISEELVVIATDTVSFRDGIPRKRILLQCTSGQITNDTIVWIEGIGELDNSKGCGFEGAKTQLQCVQEKLGETVYSLSGEVCIEAVSICSPNSFSVGDTWTLDDFSVVGGIGPTTIEIVDEVEWQGKQALVVQPGVLDSEDYMYQEDGRVYFWNKTLEEYQLNYDFNNDSLYHVRFFNFALNRVDSIAISVDSVKTVELNGDSVEIQFISGDDFGRFEVYKGIGLNYRAPRIPFKVFDVNGGALRCFDSSECSVNFSGMACDTLIETVSTNDLKIDIDINVYPNPTSERLFVETSVQTWNYRIMNVHMQQIASGFYQESIDVSSLPNGVYFLQLEEEDSIYRAIRFVKQ